jgi:F-type H+-transporting ATPase subunit b
MSIDWVTVTAQILNFLILIWLLKRFLYRPILDGIDAREAELAARRAEAEKARSAALEAEAEHREALAAFNERRDAMLAAAHEQAEAARASLVAESRQDLAAEQAEWRRQADREREAFIAGLRAEGARAILALMRRALGELADADLEDRIAAMFENRLADLADQLQEAAAETGTAVAVTAAPLSRERRASLEKAVHDIVGDVALRFEPRDDASPGVTLHVDGACVGWTIDSWLEGITQAVEDRLAATSQAGRQAG